MMENKIEILDEVFLLSIDEYKKYQQNIPPVGIDYWLRSPGCYDSDIAVVEGYGRMVFLGGFVANLGGVRPALQLPTETANKLKIGQRIMKYEFPWIYIGDHLAIAEVPVMFCRFDSSCNDYDKSEVKQKLIEWFLDRVNKQ